MKSKNENQINLLEEPPEPVEIIECKNLNEFLQILEDVYQGRRNIRENKK